MSKISIFALTIALTATAQHHITSHYDRDLVQRAYAERDKAMVKSQAYDDITRAAEAMVPEQVKVGMM